MLDDSMVRFRIKVSETVKTKKSYGEARVRVRSRFSENPRFRVTLRQGIVRVRAKVVIFLTFWGGRANSPGRAIEHFIVVRC